MVGRWVGVSRVRVMRIEVTSPEKVMIPLPPGPNRRRREGFIDPNTSECFLAVEIELPRSCGLASEDLPTRPYRASPKTSLDLRPADRTEVEIHHAYEVHCSGLWCGSWLPLLDAVDAQLGPRRRRLGLADFVALLACGGGGCAAGRPPS
jgi:hypothetical protein